MASRRLIDLTEADLEALIERRLEHALAELHTEPAPTSLDRAGMACALSCSTKTLDRLRGEPGFPELALFDSPRFDPVEVIAWLKARSANGQGLRVVGGSK